MSEQINIPGLFQTIAGRVNETFSERLTNPFNVYFDHGVYDTVNKNLQFRDESITLKEAKYPLIWLVTPLRTDKPIGADYAAEILDADILILMGTNNEVSNDERNTKYFEPFLRPIYQEFLRQIDLSCYFDVLSANAIPHEVKEWPYHSGPEDVSGKFNLFKDFIDCIQIRRLRLKVQPSIPQTFHLLNELNN